MTDRELMQMALDALEAHADIGIKAAKQIEALRARLAQPEPEGDLCCGDYDGCIRPCTPRGRWIAHKAAQREWQGLTDEERTFIAWESNNGPECVAMTEAKLKEKNT